MRRILFIVNPAAGKKNSESLIQRISDFCEANFLKFDIEISKGAGEITKLVSACMKEKPYTDLVGIGGDGTLIECINGIEDFTIRVGIIPMGTGNDFARALNISNDIEETLEIIKNGKCTLVDLGMMNSNRFVNSAGVGIDGEIISDTQKIKKIISSRFAYLLSTLYNIHKFKPFRAIVELDHEIIEGKYYLIAIGNGAYFGGGMKITPGAQINNGKFEICIVKDVSKLKFLRVLPKVYSGNHINDESVTMHKSNRISIVTPDRKMKLSADGNLVGKTPVEVRLSEKKIRMLTNGKI